MKILKFLNSKNTNIANWLILALLLTILLHSCTMPQSVGYNMKSKIPLNSQKKVIEEKQENVPKTQTATIEPDNMVNNDRLPTLREQMKMISDKQIEIEVDLDIIKSEIGLIKAELVELKSNLIKGGKFAQKEIVPGEADLKSKEINPKQIEEETFLLPDEAEQNLIPTKKNKPTISKPPQKKDNKQSHKANPDDIKTEKIAQNNNLKQQETNNDKLEIHNNITIKESDSYEKVKLAESLVNSGKIDEARKIYQEILKQNPKNELTPIAKKMLQQL